MSFIINNEYRFSFLGINIFKYQKSERNFVFRILGINLFKYEIIYDYLKVYILGIPFRKRTFFSKIINKVDNQKDFFVKPLDDDIEYITLKYINNLKSKKKEKYCNKNKIAYLATELYDTGGHTKCLRDLIASLDGEFSQALFLTQLTISFKLGSECLGDIQKHSTIIYGQNSTFLFLKKNVISLARKIEKFAPRVVFSYIHPKDIVGASILAYIHLYTDIKIIFFNHASHFPCLGMSFSDLILEGTITNKRITEQKRGFNNCYVIGLQSLSKEDTIYYSEKEISLLKKKYCYDDAKYVTMSGGTAYKFFDREGNSDYFLMIKELLQSESCLKHIIISNFNNKQIQRIKDIFNNNDCYNRLVFIPLQKKFDIFFQSADVFIDSFPISSALTQIDLMRNKVASVVKINKENPEYSFHDYQKNNYEYMFDNVCAMKTAILDLLYDSEKRKKIVEDNYLYWLNTYEKNVVKLKYLNIINIYSHI